MELTIKSENIQEDQTVPALQIDPNTTSNILVGLQFNSELKLAASSIQTIMKFTVKELNATNDKVISTYDDEF